MTISLGVATVLTVYGIETITSVRSSTGLFLLQQYLPFTVLKLSTNRYGTLTLSFGLQQYLPFTVCDEGCEAAEEQRDDEVRTSLVPDRREGKTEVIKKQHLPFMVCDDVTSTFLTYNYISIIKRAVLSVCITEAQLFHS